MPSEPSSQSDWPQTEAALRAVTQATARTRGHDFFAALVQALAQTLDVHDVLLARLLPEGDAVQTLAAWSGGAAQPTLRYELAGTPCAKVTEQLMCFHGDAVQAAYPQDLLLVELRARSYLGMPMVGSDGRTLGLLAATDRRPMPESKRLLGLALLSNFAGRAATELQALEREAELQVELQAAQARLVERETLAALGGLVAGISHELNTPVGVAVTAASTASDHARALEALLGGERISRSALLTQVRELGAASQLALDSLQRVEHLIGLFKTLAHVPQDEDNSDFDLAELLRKLLARHAARCAAAGLRVEPALGATLPMHSAPGMISELIEALIDNSLVHGMAGRTQGRLAVELLRDQDCALLRLSDDGPGVAPEARARLFLPFYTTTRGRGGVGLGLPIAYVLALRLGGALAVDPAPKLPGLGFTLRLPSKN